MGVYYNKHYGVVVVGLHQAIYLTNVEDHKIKKLFGIVKKFDDENLWGPNLSCIMD